MICLHRFSDNLSKELSVSAAISHFSKMAAVVRVKRLLDEEPTEALVLSCKRRKTDLLEEDSIKTVFKFAGTVKNPDEDISLFILNESKRNISKSINRPSPKLLEKARTETKVSSEKNRYKLVNFFRAIGDSEQLIKEQGVGQKPLTVLDVESHLEGKEKVENESEPKVCDAHSADTNYVYDLYCMQTESAEVDVDDLLLDGLVSFVPLENELVFENYRSHRVGGADSDSDSPIVDDEDDSNDESNWRNDYPDEEGSDGEDGNLAAGLFTVKLGDEELSSDDDDERLIYSEGLDLKDVNSYGTAYASFKKRTMQELNSDAEVNSDSDDCYGSARSADSDDDENNCD